MEHLEYYTVEEVASILRVTTTTIYNLCRRGAIESVNVGRAIRIPADAIKARKTEVG